LRKTNETNDDSDTHDTQIDLMQEIDFFHNDKCAMDKTLGISKDKKKISKDIKEDREGY